MSVASAAESFVGAHKAIGKFRKTRKSETNDEESDDSENEEDDLFQEGGLTRKRSSKRQRKSSAVEKAEQEFMNAHMSTTIEEAKTRTISQGDKDEDQIDEADLTKKFDYLWQNEDKAMLKKYKGNKTRNRANTTTD